MEPRQVLPWEQRLEELGASEAVSGDASETSTLLDDRYFVSATLEDK